MKSRKLTAPDGTRVIVRPSSKRSRSGGHALERKLKKEGMHLMRQVRQATKPG